MCLCTYKVNIKDTAIDSWLMPYLAWWVYATMSEMHETGGVWDKI
jgi:hypothetical protein